MIVMCADDKVLIRLALEISEDIVSCPNHALHIDVLPHLHAWQRKRSRSQIAIYVRLNCRKIPACSPNPGRNYVLFNLKNGIPASAGPAVNPKSCNSSGAVL